ncbi:MAG: TetR family transcriptional regulator, partial [Proteobacteria bacterium]|nr:TetR family transcriptional regulator [Pseudomonadota bacterium]
RRTIHFYVTSGLLHPPFKTGRTMAYYDPAHLNKLEYIKGLKKDGLPLAAIKERIEDRERKGPGFGRHAGESLGFINRRPLPPPRRAYGKKTRQAIIDVGCRLFMAKGYHQTRVIEIIEYLGQGKGSFYHFFSNKKELFLECIPLIFNDMFAQSWKRIKESADPMERLKLRMQITLPVYRELNLILKLCAEVQEDDDPKLQEMGRRIIHSVYRPVEADIQRGVELGVFRNVDARAVAFLLVGAVAGLGHFVEKPSRSLQASMEKTVFDIVARALLPGPA